jgi:hypothetical protein
MYSIFSVAEAWCDVIAGAVECALVFTRRRGLGWRFLGCLGVAVDGGAQADLAEAHIFLGATELRSHGKSLLPTLEFVSVLDGEEFGGISFLCVEKKWRRGYLLRGPSLSISCI